jgi:hypothetical protein
MAKYKHFHMAFAHYMLMPKHHILGMNVKGYSREAHVLVAYVSYFRQNEFKNSLTSKSCLD